MQELSAFSQMTLYILLVLIGLLSLIIGGWQIQVLRGKEILKPMSTGHFSWTGGGRRFGMR